MALDPRIILGGQPAQFENPLTQLAKMAQIQSAQRDSEMFGLKKQELEQSLKAKETRNKLMEALFTSDSSGDPRAVNALTQGMQHGSIGPTVQNASLMDGMPAPMPGQSRINLNLLARMEAAGIDTKGLLAIHKYQNDGIKRDPNAFYQDPVTGRTQYFADPTKGIDFDPQTKTVSPLNGFSQTNAGIKSAETNAVEGAKANFDLLPLGYVGQDGRPIGGSRGQYLAGTGLPQVGGEQPPAPAASAPQHDFVGADLLAQLPPKVRQSILENETGEGRNQFTVNYRMPDGRVIQGQVDLSRDSSGNVPRAIQEKADYIRSRATPQERQQFEQSAVQNMMKITDPRERAMAISDFYAQMAEPAGTPLRPRDGGNAVPAAGAPPAGGRPVLQSEAEREAQVGRVKMLNSVEEKQMKDDQERMTKDTRLYQQLKAAIPMARDLLKDATGSGAGALADQTMAFFGKSTKGAQAAQALDTIGGWMTANVPRMEGPQSNIDVLNYQTMAARVADRTQPTEARLAALDVLEQLQNKYAQVNGISAGEQGGGNASSGRKASNGQSTPAPQIPAAAIKLLRSNPALRGEFEVKYGPGSATSILGK